MRQKKVIVIGGGIGGLAAAVALQNNGVDVSVFERANDMRPEGAGLTLWSNATHALDRLGILSEVLTYSTIITDSEIRSEDGETLLQIRLADLAEKYGYPTITVLRSHLHNSLLKQLPPENIHVGMRCVGYQQSETGVIARFENGQQEQGDFLIGADGIHSVIRRQLFGTGADPLRYSGYTAWRGVATFDHPYSKQGFMFEAWGNGVRFGFVPAGNGQVYWFAAKNAPMGESDVPSGRKQEILQLFQDFSDPIPSVIQATHEEAILRNDIFDRKPARSWTDGRIALLGDAAHPTTPNLGQGACLALEDVVVLGDQLKAENDLVTALRMYEQQRIKRANSIVRTSRQIGVIGQWSHPVACRFRNRLVKLAPPVFQRKRLDQTIGYRA